MATDRSNRPSNISQPRPAISSSLLNGSSPLRNTNTTRPSSSRAQERNRLASSIRSTYGRRTSIDVSELGRPQGRWQGMSTQLPNGYSHDEHDEDENEEAIDELEKEVTTTIDHRLQEAPPRDNADSRTSTKPKLSTPIPNSIPHSHLVPISVSRPASPYTQTPPIDFDGLSWPCIGTHARLHESAEDAQKRHDKLANAVRTIFECIGEDPTREGLLQTPDRYAKALMFFTKGYEENVRNLVNGAVFQEDHDELVIVRDIELFSLCEHHMVPFIGRMHIGYIPNQRVLGLSKLARLAEMFARRLQVQERLTKQVALAISEVLKPQGVGVVMESSHLCMVMRGVQKTGATTTTSCMLGAMRSSAKTREEFLSLLNRGK